MQTARMELKLSQKDVAQKINEKPSILQDYESGKAIPNPQILAKLERTLGVKLRGKSPWFQRLPFRLIDFIHESQVLTLVRSWRAGKSRNSFSSSHHLITPARRFLLRLEVIRVLCG